MYRMFAATKVNGFANRNQCYGAQPCARMIPCIDSVPVISTTGKIDRPAGNLVTDDLRRRADSADQRPFVIRRPSRHQHADHRERCHRRHIENADVQVGEDQRRRKRHHRPRQRERQHHQVRRHLEQRRVGFVGNNVFLADVLDAVGQPLQEAVGADAVGTDARLDPRPYAPLDPAHDSGETETRRRGRPPRS